MEKIRIYFAGPLFDLYDRIMNRVVAAKLSEKGYDVFLPQDIVVEKNDQGRVDSLVIAEKCKNELLKQDIVVANLDGSDADSGTGVEVGIAMGKDIPVVGWRTDFRGLEEQTKWNAMFELCEEVIYVPPFEEDVNALVDALDKAIQRAYYGGLEV